MDHEWNVNTSGTRRCMDQQMIEKTERKWVPQRQQNQKEMSKTHWQKRDKWKKTQLKRKILIMTRHKRMRERERGREKERERESFQRFPCRACIRLKRKAATLVASNHFTRLTQRCCSKFSCCIVNIRASSFFPFLLNHWTDNDTL